MDTRVTLRLIVICLFTVKCLLGAAVLTTSKSAPVIGQVFVFTYTNDDTNNYDSTVVFSRNGITVALCRSSADGGRCGSGYTDMNITRQSEHVITLQIEVFDRTQHAGVWNVIEGNSISSNTLNLVEPFASAAVLTTSKSSPVIGQVFVFTYTNDDTNIYNSQVDFKRNGITVALCRSSADGGRCGSGYTDMNITRQSEHVITLQIEVFDRTQHAGVWNVIEGNSISSNTLNLVDPFATIVDKSVIDFTDACPKTTDIDSQQDFTITITTGCAYPTVNVAWLSTGKTNVTLTPVITSDSTGCSAPQVKTTAVLTLNRLTLQGRVNLTSHMIHPSFDNDIYDKWICIANFPVQVTTVKFQNITSQNQKIGTREDTIKLTCVTSPSNPVPYVSWYKNGLQISSGITNTRETIDSLIVITSSLSLTVSRSDDGHTVSCRAGIPGQTPVTSNTGILDVWYGPYHNDVIVETSGNKTAVDGRQLILTCRTQSAVKPDVNFSWRFTDGTDVTGTRGNKQGSSGNPWSQSLTLTPSKAPDRQRVQCTVKNTQTLTEFTGQKDLDVKYPPSAAPAISGTPFPAFEENTVTLRCYTTGGHPKPSLTWFCLGISVSQFCSDSGETRTCTATFTANRNQNNKNCVCTPAWKYGGYTQSTSTQILIYYPPDRPILSLVTHQPWLENTPGTLSCSIPAGGDGNPAATMYWMRNGVLQHTGSIYLFTPTKEDNEAEFMCTAGNKFTDKTGKSRPESNPVQLNVHYAPRVKISPGSHTRVELGKLLILSCSADSNPDIASFEWTLGTKHLVDGPEFQIAAFHESNQAKYTCSATTVSDRHGSLTGSANAIVTVLEPAPVSCYCTDRSGTTVELVWEYERNNKSSGFTIAQRLSKETHWIPLPLLDVQRDDNTYSLHVSNLKSNSAYYFKIFSSVIKDDSNFCLTTCTTSILPREALSAEGLGLGSGIAIGLVIGIVLASIVAVLIHLVLMRKGCLIRSDAKCLKETDVYQDIATETVQQGSPSADASRMQNEPTNAYDSLQSREPTQYEQIHMYTNTPQNERR